MTQPVCELQAMIQSFCDLRVKSVCWLLQARKWDKVGLHYKMYIFQNTL